MNKTLGKDIESAIERRRFLEDNADAVEEKGYMRAYSPEELQGHKESLANTMIAISAIEEELQAVKTEFKAKLKPLQEKKTQMVANIKAKAEYVTENCFKFVDREARMTGYYNADGDLVEARPSTANEMQLNMFINHDFGANAQVQELRDGTND